MISSEKIITVAEIVFAFLVLYVAMAIYKDARSRNMWALLWTYVAIMLPVAGWIIYLFIRSRTPQIQCPDCFERTTRGDLFCYRCSYNFVRLAKERKVFTENLSEKL